MPEFRFDKREAAEVLPRVAECAFCGRPTRRRLRTRIGRDGIIRPRRGGGLSGFTGSEPDGCLWLIALVVAIVAIYWLCVAVARLYRRLAGIATPEPTTVGTTAQPAAPDSEEVDLPVCLRHSWSTPTGVRLVSRTEDQFTVDGLSEEFLAAYDLERSRGK